jgi:uncharacterized membrane protein
MNHRGTESTVNPGGDRLLIIAGVILGMSLAGLFDGIVLHQLLQWHHMVTTIRPTDSLADLEANTFWDGIFLAGISILGAIGLIVLWRSAQHNRRLPTLPTLTGALGLGFGAFNLTEGIIDHHLLGIHHVKSGPNEPLWDVGFLLLNLCFAAIGLFILRSQARSNPSSDQIEVLE